MSRPVFLWNEVGWMGSPGQPLTAAPGTHLRHVITFSDRNFCETGDSGFHAGFEDAFEVELVVPD
jgi:hypothetical protein